MTLALVTATYALAEKLGTSGPLAIMAAGLIIGDRGPRRATSETTRKYVFALWSLIDEVLNSVLFLLIGLENTLLNVVRDAAEPLPEIRETFAEHRLQSIAAARGVS